MVNLSKILNVALAVLGIVIAVRFMFAVRVRQIPPGTISTSRSVHTNTQNVRAFFLPKVRDIVGDVSGQTIIITGPTSGIGLATTRELVKKGAIVILAVRNVPKGEALKRSLIEGAEAAGRPRPQIQVEELDVSSLASVRRFAKRWYSNLEGIPLDVLINNAGINDITSKKAVLTVDGFERHLATNYVGPSLLTRLLLPALLRTGEATGRTSRVVHVASILHVFGALRRGDLNLEAPGAYDHTTAYSNSKLLQILFSWELQRRAQGKILSVAVHPGAVSTDISRDARGVLRALLRVINAIFSLSKEQGSRSSLFAATNPKALAWASITTEPVYLHWDARRVRVYEQARDPEAAAWLWDWTAGVTGVPADIAEPLSASASR